MRRSGAVDCLPRHVDTAIGALEGTVLEGIGGELMQREGKQLHRLVR